MKCIDECRKSNTPCKNKECRLWIDYPDEYNCIHETVERHGSLTLREAGKRLKVSFARIKQIEIVAINKIRALLR